MFPLGKIVWLDCKLFDRALRLKGNRIVCTVAVLVLLLSLYTIIAWLAHHSLQFLYIWNHKVYGMCRPANNAAESLSISACSSDVASCALYFRQAFWKSSPSHPSSSPHPHNHCRMLVLSLNNCPSICCSWVNVYSSSYVYQVSVKVFTGSA